ncbi:MAG: hypothetical protein F7C81_05430 [Desulfurococcales archaeon]|nr:hypothetical protein [Desulfurococcales archaeon]
MARVAKTVIVRSVRLPKRVFRVFVELEGMYRNMVEQLVLYAARSNIKSFTRLKALKYRWLRSLYPQLPSHYAYTACQDSAARVKGFYRGRVKRLAREVLGELLGHLGCSLRELSVSDRRHIYRVLAYVGFGVPT